MNVCSLLVIVTLHHETEPVEQG